VGWPEEAAESAMSEQPFPPHAPATMIFCFTIRSEVVCDHFAIMNLIANPEHLGILGMPCEIIFTFYWGRGT
jgi:hypothetical protein